ncbi:MBL fold metallo-hydrolase [Bradyrhizobium sp. BR 1433]|uniref:MBL fold metallo-hydrolase n=1 Tax=Bradyrhizobium sp. BR 1433 TaxID=3447967 RepID=UPI003EE67E59
MDKIRWINHAGFELQTEGLRIVCDPWLDGLVFNKSWALISPTKMQPEDFRDVDYLWLSHEHPDHFSPPSLRSIPQDIRKDITVLFQASDGRVAKFCRDLGFKMVRELKDWERCELGSGVSITIKTVDDDSLCLIETRHRRYLNINDCVAPDAKALHSAIAPRVGKIDVLLTQFSFANWAGNPDEPEIARRQARQKIDQIETQLAIYQPKVFIPCASFVWFCREGNFHLNASANKIADVYARFAGQVESVVLYPGDEYVVGESHDSASAIARYRDDEASHSRPLNMRDAPVSVAELNLLSIEHQKNMRNSNWMWSLLPFRISGYIKPVSVYLTDIDRRLVYSMFTDIHWLSGNEVCDIELSSDAMAQMLRFGFGYDTLYISGRFKENRAGARFDLSKNFVVLRKNERGKFFPGALFDFSDALGRIRGALSRAT